MYSHYVIRDIIKREPDVALGIGPPLHTVEGAIVSAHVGKDDVGEAVLGSAAVGGVVGEDGGGAANAEEAVGDKHGAVLAEVAAWGDDLGAYYQCIVVGVRLEQVLGQVQGDELCVAPHPGDVESLHLGPHLEPFVFLFVICYTTI